MWRAAMTCSVQDQFWKPWQIPPRRALGKKTEQSLPIHPMERCLKPIDPYSISNLTQTSSEPQQAGNKKGEAHFPLFPSFEEPSSARWGDASHSKWRNCHLPILAQFLIFLKFSSEGEKTQIHWHHWKETQQWGTGQGIEISSLNITDSPGLWWWEESVYLTPSKYQKDPKSTVGHQQQQY